MITVATYNMRKAIAADRRRRPERVLEVLAELDADIVALQEADRRFGAKASALPPAALAAAGWRPVPFGVRPGGIGWHGNAIVVRERVEIVDQSIIVLPALEPRGAVLADLRVGGAELRVVGMHLDLSGLWRRRQARAIQHALARQPGHKPTLLMGDTNEWRLSGGCLGDFAAHWRILPTGASFHARRPMGRLDRIMVSNGIRAEAVGVHDSPVARRMSDHLPVWARLALG